jgi:hypothetical protein
LPYFVKRPEPTLAGSKLRFSVKLLSEIWSDLNFDFCVFDFSNCIFAPILDPNLFDRRSAGSAFLEIDGKQALGHLLCKFARFLLTFWPKKR